MREIYKTFNYTARKQTIRNGKRTMNKRPTVNFTENDVRKDIWSMMVPSEKRDILHISCKHIY